MPTSMEILDYATQITLDSIWNVMVSEAIQNSKTGNSVPDCETRSTGFCDH